VKPQISLVVCTLGRNAPLVRLLESLRAQPGVSFQVVLVDQNPPGYLSDTLARFADLDLCHVHCDRGLSRARNAGLRAGSGDLIGFPDDDCWYAPGRLQRIRAFFDRHDAIDILTGRTIDASGRESASRFQARSGPILRNNVFVAGNSSTLFVRRAAAQAVGGFDEALGVGSGTPFQSGEESDFLLRCIAAGYRGYFDRDHEVFHEQVSVTPARARAYSTGFGRVARKHSLGPAYFAARTARTFAGGCYRLMRGDLDGAHQRWQWLAGSIRGYTAPLPRGNLPAAARGPAGHMRK